MAETKPMVQPSVHHYVPRIYPISVHNSNQSTMHRETHCLCTYPEPDSPSYQTIAVDYPIYELSPLWNGPFLYNVTKRWHDHKAQLVQNCKLRFWKMSLKMSLSTLEIQSVHWITQNCKCSENVPNTFQILDFTIPRYLTFDMLWNRLWESTWWHVHVQKLSAFPKFSSLTEFTNIFGSCHQATRTLTYHVTPAINLIT